MSSIRINSHLFIWRDKTRRRSSHETFDKGRGDDCRRVFLRWRGYPDQRVRLCPPSQGRLPVRRAVVGADPIHHRTPVSFSNCPACRRETPSTIASYAASCAIPLGAKTLIGYKHRHVVFPRPPERSPIKAPMLSVPLKQRQHPTRISGRAALATAGATRWAYAVIETEMIPFQQFFGTSNADAMDCQILARFGESGVSSR